MSQPIDCNHSSHLFSMLSWRQPHVPFEERAKAPQAAVSDFQANVEHAQAGVRQQLLRSFDTKSRHKSMRRFVKRATKGLSLIHI